MVRTFLSTATMKDPLRVSLRPSMDRSMSSFMQPVSAKAAIMSAVNARSVRIGTVWTIPGPGASRAGKALHLLADDVGDAEHAGREDDDRRDVEPHEAAPLAEHAAQVGRLRGVEPAALPADDRVGDDPGQRNPGGEHGAGHAQPPEEPARLDLAITGLVGGAEHARTTG